jgi:hypothetical protein
LSIAADKRFRNHVQAQFFYLFASRLSFFTLPDLVVAITEFQLTAYRVVDGKLSVSFNLARLDPQDAGRFTPVMVEWATGKFVEAWDHQMTALKLPSVKTKTTKNEK